MTTLIVGLVLFLGVHSLSIINEPLRNRLNASMGEGAFKGLYSVVSLVGLVLIVWGYGAARMDPTVIYVPPGWLKHVSFLLLVPVFPLLFATYFPGKIKEKLGHPMLAAVKLWALAHLLANGMLHDMDCGLKVSTCSVPITSVETCSLVYSTGHGYRCRL